ncbi:hypothetical protein [Chryseobacterium gallinarum]|nr:hypothetical protein [Chryseobacterium gallinarum]
MKGIVGYTEDDVVSTKRFSRYLRIACLILFSIVRLIEKKDAVSDF